MDSQTQQFVARLGVLGPLILECLAILALVVIVVTHDGETTQQVTNALLALIGANVIAGGGVAVVHAFKSGPTPAPASAPSPAQDTSGTGDVAALLTALAAQGVQASVAASVPVVTNSAPAVSPPGTATATGA